VQGKLLNLHFRRKIVTKLFGSSVFLLTFVPQNKNMTALAIITILLFAIFIGRTTISTNGARVERPATALAYIATVCFALYCVPLACFAFVLTLFLAQAEVGKVQVAKVRFEKNGYGINVTDLSDHYKYLRMMTVQLFFKTGVGIFYELKEVKQK